MKLTRSDYARMAKAAGELVSVSLGVRREMNEALSDYYRALSKRVSVTAEARKKNNCRINYD